MRAKDIIPASKPRNFVAKNQKTGGAGAHKDKKKAAKQGDVKHKGKEMAEAQVNELSKDTLSNYSDKADMDIVKKHRVREPQRQAGDKAAVSKTDKKIDKRMKGIDSANKRINKEDVAEAGMYRRPGSPTAYDRDYASSVSGMGKRDSLAYRMDGGANDEGWGKEKYQAPEDKPVLKGYYFYDVKPGQEDEAAIYGVKKTKSGKWAKALYSTSGRSFGMQKDGADKAFGPGKFWSPKK